MPAASPIFQLSPDSTKTQSSSKMLSPQSIPSNSNIVRDIDHKFCDFEFKFNSLFNEYSSLVSSVRSVILNQNSANPVEDIDYTLLSNMAIKDKINLCPRISRAVKIAPSYLDSSEDRSVFSTILSTDGSLIACNGLKASAAAVVVCPDSPHNISKVVFSTRSSTVSELFAIHMAITYAFEKRLKSICVSSDSQSAILIMLESFNLPVSASNKLQSLCLKVP